jgi:hypothetical protein
MIQRAESLPIQWWLLMVTTLFVTAVGSSFTMSKTRGQAGPTRGT